MIDLIRMLGQSEPISLKRTKPGVNRPLFLSKEKISFFSSGVFVILG